MVVVGGLGSHFIDWKVNGTDEWKQGLGVLDMTTVSWSSSYDANAPAYESSQMVKDWYTKGYKRTRSLFGTENGADEYHSGLASVSWTSDSLKALFNTQSEPASGSGSGSGSGTTVDGSNGFGSQSGANAGAIAGGVVGGLVVLCLVVAAFIFKRRRKGLQLLPQQTTSTQFSTANHTELDSKAVLVEKADDREAVEMSSDSALKRYEMAA